MDEMITSKVKVVGETRKYAGWSSSNGSTPDGLITASDGILQARQGRASLTCRMLILVLLLNLAFYFLSHHVQRSTRSTRRWRTISPRFTSTW